MKISTWMPLFSGFYESIWLNCDTELNDIEYINEQRAEKKLKPITYDNLEIDYKGYQDEVGRLFCQHFGDVMKDYIKSAKFEKISSPKEYNYSTDVIHCTFEPKIRNIKKYLEDNEGDFRYYIKENYTSYSGFGSFYSDNMDIWFDKDALKHTHKLGSVLQFIAERELDEDVIFDNLQNNGTGISEYITNYDDLLKEGE